MKYIYSIILLAFVSCNGETAETTTTSSNETGQEQAMAENINTDDLRQQLTDGMKGYFEEFNKQNWDGVLDKMYPGFFNIVSKDQVKQSFSQMKGMGMEMRTKFNSLDKISDMYEHETGKYCRAYYDAELLVTLSGPMLANVDQIKSSFSNSSDASEITFDETTNTLNVKAKKSMIAVSEDEGASWYYIDFNEAQLGLLNQILPAEVLQALI